MLRFRFWSDAPEGARSKPLSPCGQARLAAEPECSKRVVLALCRSVAEAAARHCAPSRVMAPRASMVAASFTWPEPKRGSGASSTPGARPKPFSERRSYPVGATLPKRRVPARVPPGRGCAIPPTEVGLHAHRHPADASRRRATEVVRERKTRSGDPATSPMGFGSFRRMNPGDRCTGLPHRHRPLSEFLTLSAV